MLIETVTNLGLIRNNNEDRLLVRNFNKDSVLLALADGMGGHAAGEVAAELALDSMAQFSSDPADALGEFRSAVLNAQQSILEASKLDRSLRGMGTTLTAVFISGFTAHWVQVGDSRLYLFRALGLQQITEDHTIPGTLLKKGEISREQARLHPYGNVLLKCVGCERCEPDTGTFQLDQGDLLLLSSDGLHDLLSDAQITASLNLDISLRDKLDRMVKECLNAGGKDNITAILLEVN